jgi:NitT/TauT family transport system permease protein
MALILFHTRRVREALKQRESWGADFFFLLMAAALVGGLIAMGRQVSAPSQQKVEISLSYWALPKYTMLSLGRGFAAYALSLIFTLVYGSIAAHNRRAEKVMLPALDVLQSIPVLSFLPALVLAMISLFPTREIGLEIACVIMIFTAQAWNMTFSFYGSVRNIPSAMREVAVINGLSRWRVFRLLEVPASMIGLVWNSMMSMAGGWFILNVNESFTLGDKDFRLPGIGSYMSEAINQGNIGAEIAAVVAMMVMIVVVDQIFWRPIVVWSERFKMEDTAEADRAQSWVLSLMQHSRLWQWALRRFAPRRRPLRPATLREGDAEQKALGTAASRRGPVIPGPALFAIKWVTLIGLTVGAIWGGTQIVRLLLQLPGAGWRSVLLALLASFGRTSAAVIIGAAWALPAGILIGLSPRWSQRLQPVIQVVASFPATMVFPLVTFALLAIHVPFTIGCITLMLLGTQWYILFNVIAGAMAIPGELKEVAHLYRTSRLQRWFRLYIPGVFPYLVTGMVTAAGGAWNATIVSEYVETKYGAFRAFGLGSMISDATAHGDFPRLAAATVVMAFAVVLLNRLIWKKLFRVAESRYSLS